MKPKPKQASPVTLARSIPRTRKPIDPPLYSTGDRIIANVVILLVSFGASFLAAKEITWYVTGYVPPVRCGSVAAEFQRQVAEGAINATQR